MHKVYSELSVDLDLVQEWEEIYSKMCLAHVESCVHVCSCATLNWFSHIFYPSYMDPILKVYSSQIVVDSCRD